jgi:hypothetical protein
MPLPMPVNYVTVLIIMKPRLSITEVYYYNKKRQNPFFQQKKQIKKNYFVEVEIKKNYFVLYIQNTNKKKCATTEICCSVVALTAGSCIIVV